MKNNDFTLTMVKQVLNAIKEKNIPFFVSEAHLQTEFIITAAKLFPDFEYFPEIAPSNIPDEYNKKFGKSGIHFDLVINTGKEKVLIEFKYLTKKFPEKRENDSLPFSIKNQSAMNIRRYDCWKDISRIETFVTSDNTISYGYFILITNDLSLKKEPLDTYLYREFSIAETTHKSGERKWGEGMSKNSKKGRENPICIKNNYEFKYEEFKEYKGKNGRFEFLVVEIQ